MIPSCLAIDVGTERVGVATNVGSLVLPGEVISRASFANWLQKEAPAHTFLIVGLPIDLQGQLGVAAKSVVSFVQSLSIDEQVVIRFVDERLTTAIAGRRLRDAGKNSRNSRGIIDAQAAAEILELALSVNPNQPGRNLDEF